MFGAIVRGWRLKAAARSYARRLGLQLLSDYGVGPTYTEKQIQASVARARLPMAFIHLGYAGFMTEDAFLALDRTHTTLRYAELRVLLQRYTRRPSPSSAFAPAPENQWAVGAVPPPWHQPGP